MENRNITTHLKSTFQFNNLVQKMKCVIIRLIANVFFGNKVVNFETSGIINFLSLTKVERCWVFLIYKLIYFFGPKVEKMYLWLEPRR